MVVLSEGEYALYHRFPVKKMAMVANSPHRHYKLALELK
jgi:hypothetical protein